MKKDCPLAKSSRFDFVTEKTEKFKCPKYIRRHGEA